MCLQGFDCDVEESESVSRNGHVHGCGNGSASRSDCGCDDESLCSTGIENVNESVGHDDSWVSGNDAVNLSENGGLKM